jgi:hypothetical protein
MMVVPWPKVNPYYPIYISMRDNFFALSGSSFERLALRSRIKPSSKYHCLARPWQKLQDAPFESKYVASYAVHPDQQTMFVSVLGFDCISTFSFCTTGCLKWEERGDWALPFTNQAHFDLELNAWVGLSTIPNLVGHICTCNVASTTSDAEGSTGQCLARRLGKEYLLSNEPSEETIGFNLVYMGGKSCFYLVEAILISSIVDENAYGLYEDEGSSYTDDDDEEGPLITGRYLLRLTTFSLKFDENGDLTTDNSRRVQYYNVSEDATKRVLEHPFAFWM